MSQLAVWIGRSYIELSRKSGNNTATKRVTYSINSLATQLKSALNAFVPDGQEISKVYLDWHLPYLAVDKELGTAPAFLTTAGMEAWLELNLPLRPAHWSVHLARVTSPVNRDLCFGVSERTSAQGEILRAPENSELEFLVSKLRMNQVSHVSVGFLHAATNPANEKKVVEFFREQGFTVAASHEWSREPEERPRFLSAIVENYVDGFLAEKLTEVQNTLAAVGIATDKIHFHDQPVSTYLGPQRRWLKPLSFLQFARPTLYCGIDELIWFLPNEYPDWVTNFGKVALPGIGGRRVGPTPLQRIGRNFWNGIDWTDETVDLEPGPMCFGKSTIPTLLDVFYTTGKLQTATGLSERITDRNNKKIVDALRAHTRSEGGRDEQDVIDGLLRSVAENWRLQINHNGAIHLQGPLAATVYNVFKHVGLEAGIVLHPEDFYISDLILSGASR